MYKSLRALSLGFLVCEKTHRLDQKINGDEADLGPWPTTMLSDRRLGRGGREGPGLTAVALSIAAEIGVIFVRLALVQVRVIGNQVF